MPSAPAASTPAPSAPSAPAGYERRRVLWLSLAQLITWGSVFYGFALLMEPVERELGIGRAEASLAFSIALLAEGIFGYPVGVLIDRGHERAVMTGGSLLVGAALIAHSTITSLAGFYAVWAVLGMGLAATLYAPVFAVVTRRYPQDFRRAIITLTFLGGLASTVCIPLTSWLIAQWGWRHALWPLAALQWLVCAPLHAWWLRGAPRGVARPAGAARSSPSARSHLRSGPFLLIGLFIVLMMGVTAALPAHMVSLLREAGLSEAWVVVVPATVGVLQVFGRALLYVFERRFDVHRANRVIPCLIPAGLLLLLATPALLAVGPAWGATGLFLFVLFYGMGNGMMTIVKGTAIAEYVNREHVASLNGALGVPQALARASAPWALGVLWNPAVGYRHGLWLLLGLCVLAVAGLVSAQRRALQAAQSAG
jgi:MFS family permease